MKWGNKRFKSLDYQLKEEFEEKVYKLALDGGFTCPNRDGKISEKGCIFCSDKGSGEFAGEKEKSIKEQIKDQKENAEKKYGKVKYIAYFQNFTNTYANIEYLEKIYYEALEEEDVVGLAIATRPDCINDEVFKLLERINRETFLWVELGLQTIHEKSALMINRGYPLNIFEETLKKLNRLKIKTVVHLILGLPNETYEDIFSTIDYINRLEIWGVKLHLLHIIKNTELAYKYEKEKFHILELSEYIMLVCDIIEKLSYEIGIHRLTGDGEHSSLIVPLWSKNKRKVLNSIDMELKARDGYQGKYYGGKNEI